MILHPASRSRRLGFPGLSSTDRPALALGRRLDDDYHWFRSIAPGGIPVIDAIVVGPGGTWTLTMAGERGRFARRNGHWYRWNRSTESWVPWDAIPITAARLSGRRLSLYLERAGLPAPSADANAAFLPLALVRPTLREIGKNGAPLPEMRPLSMTSPVSGRRSSL